MKYIILCFMTLSSVMCLNAFPARIQSWNLDEDIKTISSFKISIDSVNRSSGAIIVDLRNGYEFDKLLSYGFDAVRLPDVTRDYYEYLISCSSDDPMQAYYSIDEYHTFMQQTAALYPNICSLVQYGTSGQNRPLYALKISDNVQINESEPELKYIGSIHGDETVGYDMLIRLIQLLTSQYGIDPRITTIVNNTEMWISPMMNPDGYVLGQRYNAAGIDLNRNFPMPTGVDHPDDNNWGIENIAMMDFSNAHNFALSINFHGGALVINYPWDYTPVLATDDALLQQLSLTYSMHNQPMYNSTEFPQGITNGAAWYIITGSMQDWNYGFTSCIEVTAEISNTKWPAASTLDTYWAQNQESLLSYIEFAQRGIKGIVTNTAQNPIPATIKINGNTKWIRNDPVVGDYHRILLPGTYTVNVSSPGYINQSVVVTVPPSGYVTQNFVLEAAQLTSCSGQVRDLAGLPIAGALITMGDEGSQAVSDAMGNFTISGIYEGIYELTASAAGFGVFQNELNLRSNSGRQVIVLAPPLFSDDFEATLTNWTVTSPWAIVQQDGNGVLTDSPSGNYGNNVNRAIRLTSPLNLQNVRNPRLSLKARWDLETSYDYVYVEGSSNLSNWREIHRFTGQQNQWQSFTFPLDDWTTGNFYLRFRLRSDFSTTADGIYIDDVIISGYPASSIIYGDADSNSIVNKQDAEYINQYGIGLDPLTFDPYPWDAARITSADVNANGNISAWDAYQVLKYITEPEFRFQPQSGQVLQAQPADISLSLYTTLALSISEPQNLKALQLDLEDGIEINDVDYNNPDPGLYQVSAVNSMTGRYSSASISPFPSLINFSLSGVQNDLDCQIENNGIIQNYHITASSAPEDIPSPNQGLSLSQNYPNPFNPQTTIRFHLPKTSFTTLSIYNTKGQQVRALAMDDLKSGIHNVVWDGLDDQGNTLPAGIYLYRLSQTGQTIMKKMVLSK